MYLFLASTASTQENLSNTFNQIDRQDVGITLRITPQISSGDFVTLEIFTEVSSVIAATAVPSLMSVANIACERSRCLATRTLSASIVPLTFLPLGLSAVYS